MLAFLFFHVPTRARSGTLRKCLAASISFIALAIALETYRKGYYVYKEGPSTNPQAPVTLLSPILGQLRTRFAIGSDRHASFHRKFL